MKKRQKKLSAASRPLGYLKVPLYYALIGAAWIFFSDKLVGFLFSSPEALATAQTYKGWFFIVFTALLLAVLIHRDQKALERVNANLETEVRNRTSELSKANEELKDSLDVLVRNERMAAMGKLVSGFSHEISTPIGNARMAISYLADLTKANGTADRKTTAELIESAEKSLSQASSLVNTFKSVTHDRSSGKVLRFSLMDIINETVGIYERNFKKNFIACTVEIPKDLHITEDPGIVSHIIGTLLGNSLTHAFDEVGGTILIAATTSKERITLTYADDGKGMDEAAQKDLFEPFSSLRATPGNAGLGMYVVYNLIENNLGGEISVESRPGKGTAYTINLPKT